MSKITKKQNSKTLQIKEFQKIIIYRITGVNKSYLQKQATNYNDHNYNRDYIKNKTHLKEVYLTNSITTSELNLQ
ncbi:hypothetical protein DZS_18300 [Dickeya ananatis]